MTEFTVAQLGAFAWNGDNGASIIGDIVITPLVRTVGVAANALSKRPVQTTDFISDFGTIAFHTRLAGINSLSETAPDHMLRMWANLETEVAKDANTLLVYLSGVTSGPRSYSIAKNGPMDETIAKATQSRSVIEFDVLLNYT
jgi:hypothetical protein